VETANPGGNGDGDTSRTETQPTGTPGCTAGAECSSTVCLLDVTGTARCCESDCLARGRVCSTAGTCACAAGAEEVGGECLLSNGERCREAKSCSSNRCVDGVCCDASCDRFCERCDAPDQAGRCVFDAEDQACVTDRPGFQCTKRGRCGLPQGAACGVNADCSSEHCEPADTGQPICCESACHDRCQLCGAAGSCDDFPATDDDCEPVTCPADTICRTYATPPARACGANGACAACRGDDTPAGVPCGVGARCDGKGGCLSTGIGSVAAGGRHTCAIFADANVHCWGRNLEGQLGAAFDVARIGDDENPVSKARELDFEQDVVALTAGWAHTCALFARGSVRCWGVGDHDAYPQSVAALLGVDPESAHLNELGFVDPLLAEDVHLPAPAVQISAGPSGAHTCALLTSGDVACWGFNAEGQCGLGDTNEHVLTPGSDLTLLELGGARALEVSAADAHTCVLLEHGEVICFGSGRRGRLGYGSSASRSYPYLDGPVPVGEPVLHIATIAGSTCALLAGGRVRCWGYDDVGQLGYGHSQDIGEFQTPAEAVTLPGPGLREFLGGDVPVGGGATAVQLVPAADSRAVCALFEGGSVRCWGENDHGELGYGHTEGEGPTHTPDELAIRWSNGRRLGGDLELDGAVRILAEGGRCAVMAAPNSATGAPPLFCWGRDDDGELGLPAHFPAGSATLTPHELGPVNLEP
jgi:alpha-tubulin suppressor-like RCC1 family protein